MKSFRLWSLHLSVAMLFLMALNCTVAADSDDPIRTNIVKALTARTAAINQANTTLAKSFDQAINDLSSGGFLDATKAVMAEKDAFQTKGKYPQSNLMANFLSDYANAREAANHDLAQAFDDAVSAYTQQLKVKEATAIRDEKTKFLAAEEKAMGSIASKKADAPAVATEFFKDFTSRFDTRINQVAALDTAAKKKDQHQAVVKEFDEELSKKTLSIHFPIVDVQPLTGTQNQNNYRLTLKSPREIESIPEQWKAMPTYELRLSSDEV
ncbi:MAG TPA: hypothetical protein VGJ04_07740, partial [Pirellulales bacterium]